LLDDAAVKYETPGRRKAADRKMPTTIAMKHGNISNPLIAEIVREMPRIKLRITEFLLSSERIG